MIAHPVLADAAQGVVERLHPDPGVAAVLLQRRLRNEGRPGVRQARIVDLEDQPRIDDGQVFGPHHLREREHEVLVGGVVFVEDEMVDPSRRDGREERVRLAACQGRLEAFDLGLQHVQALVAQRRGADDATGPRDGRPRRVRIGVVLAEGEPLAALEDGRAHLARAQVADLDPLQPVQVVVEAPPPGELAVADHVDAGRELLVDDVVDGSSNHPGELVLVDGGASAELQVERGDLGQVGR